MSRSATATQLFEQISVLTHVADRPGISGFGEGGYQRIEAGRSGRLATFGGNLQHDPVSTPVANPFER